MCCESSVNLLETVIISPDLTHPVLEHPSKLMEKFFMAFGSYPKCNLNAIFQKLQSKGISCFILQSYQLENELL